MIVQVRDLGGSNADGMHFRALQAVEVIKLDRGKGNAYIFEAIRRCLQHAALICRADDKHAHIIFSSSFQGRAVPLIHRVPVQVHIIKPAVLLMGNALEDDLHIAMP